MREEENKEGQEWHSLVTRVRQPEPGQSNRAPEASTPLLKPSILPSQPTQSLIQTTHSTSLAFPETRKTPGIRALGKAWLESRALAFFMPFTGVDLDLFKWGPSQFGSSFLYKLWGQGQLRTQ